ncbi:MAG: DUF4238 domain-containing protein [Candidatus Tokpelaia sp.]|nr:MAG: DUF4238 domain-containing protein [Candidatus Tokpelaia sp.]KAA6206070.1 MAG: DUF4238 domain-containing protein [Candidatus Tokpelaia sp.]
MLQMDKTTEKRHTPDYTSKQHFIPQFLLKNFTIEKVKKGHLYEYKKTTSEIRKRHINQVAYAPHLYSIEADSERDDRLEKAFSKVETEAAPIIEKIIAKRSLTGLKDEEIQYLAEFLISLYSRSAYAVNFVNQHAPDELENIENRLKQEFPAKATEIEKVIARKKIKGAFYTDTFPASHEHSFKYITKYMEMALYTTPKGCRFVLSDRYALLCSKPAINLTPGNTQIENIHAIYCPISSDLCIVFREKKTPDNDLHWRNELQSLTELQLAQVNNLAVKSCNQYIYCEDEDSLKKVI